MSQVERLRCDKRLSWATRMVAAEIFRNIDPLTGRARITAEQLAEKLRIGVGTVRKATTVLTGRSYFRKVKIGRNIEFVPASTLETDSRSVDPRG